MERVTEKEWWDLKARTLYALTWNQRKAQERESDHLRIESAVATEEAELEGRCSIAQD
ncbi:hypothetical protein EST38_g13013 [Candolleomyces aberdarensis]|uniref:Uncharacterized protein n=1 Tax=Candolleomyces aberdarensis TaxID=2316362 RepID=A0A4Q2D109_9AGAR|nr:hypothetical protein EST38_g13013 [Candolleomyces aberdarensis]